MLNWYNLPTYYDVSFSHEMREETTFLKAIFKKNLKAGSARLLEPACGTGRLIMPLARAGYHCTGFDINTHALAYFKQRLKRNRIQAVVFEANMSDFSINKKKFDAAYCTVDTFRHLLKQDEARQHLIRVAKVLKKNGIYILGLHLLPIRGITNKVSRWTAKRGRLTVHTSMSLIAQNKRQRTETLKVVLTSSNEDRYESIYRLRTYTLKQFKQLIVNTDVFTIETVYDHYYDISKSVILDSKSDYGVFLLRKID